jgi:hypothetical protein
VVVDGDVHELPANGLADSAGRIGVLGVVGRVTLTADAFARATDDPAELLDVDMDELARTRALVTDRLLEPDPAELAHPDPGHDSRNGRQRHPERLRDLSAREPQPPQLDDHLDTIRSGPVGDTARRGSTITQPSQTLEPIATDPLPSTAATHTRGGSRQPRPSSPLRQQARTTAAYQSS